jgi:hypothetical protein
MLDVKAEQNGAAAPRARGLPVHDELPPPPPPTRLFHQDWTTPVEPLYGPGPADPLHDFTAAREPGLY